MLRSLKQAVYSPENKGHFGLSLDEYAHFTSPIRRYPDLLVHRAIRHVLRSGGAKKKTGMARVTGALKKMMGGSGPAKTFHYSMSDMEKLGENCSVTERRADEATRDVNDWLKCEYMMDKVGEDFDGIVTSVLGFGLFVELADIYVEGLVHITSLRNDYYHFDAAKHTLSGEHSRTVYQLGGKVRVKVARVDLDDKKIDFEMLDDEGESLPSDRPARGGKSSGKKGAKRSRKKPADTAEKKTVKKKAGKKKSARKKVVKKKAAETSNDESAETAAPKKKRRRRRRKPKAKPAAE